MMQQPGQTTGTTGQAAGQSLDDYYQALDRLEKGRPIRVPKGVKITNDAVSLEAGKQKGSIKKSRAVFAKLIEAIDKAATVQASRTNEQKRQLDKAKMTAEQLREELEAVLIREMCLLYELYETKRKLEKLTGENVLPLRPPGESDDATED